MGKRLTEAEAIALNAEIAGLPQPIDLAFPDYDFDKAVQLTMAMFGVIEVEAGFRVGLERGDISGDVEAIEL